MAVERKVVTAHRRATAPRSRAGQVLFDRGLHQSEKAEQRNGDAQGFHAVFQTVVERDR